jgi:hypothetical protein
LNFIAFKKAQTSWSGNSQGNPFLVWFFATVICFMLYLIVGLVNYWEGEIYSKADEWTVSQETCTCDCWDRRIKGKSMPFPKWNRMQYKSLYINCDKEMIWILFVTVFYCCCGLKFFEKLISALLYRRSDVRWELVAILGPFLYSNVYCWWVTITYINDRWYHMWNHQLYFTVTEWVIALCIYAIIDKKNEPPQNVVLWTLFILPLTHATQFLLDKQIFVTSGILRDFVLLAPDVILFVYSCKYMRLLERLRNPAKAQETRRELALAMIAVFIQLLFLTFVIPSPW